MMGGGIAYANAVRGVACVLKDVSLETAEKGKGYTEKVLSAQEKARRKKNLALIKPTADYKDLAGCDLIIEAVFEKRELKAQVTKEAEPMLAADGFFASNTSTLPITGLAQGLGAPGEIHRPAFLLAGGQDGAGRDHQRREDLGRDAGARLRLRAADRQDADRGQRFARLLHQPHLRHLRAGRLRDAGRGHSRAPAIENAARQAGMPVGPLAVIDQTSMSLSVHVMEQTIADLTAEGKPLPPEHPGQKVIVKMVKELNRPGRAAAAASTTTRRTARRFLWPELAKHLRQARRARGTCRR